eukprot:gene61261-81664_t
MFLLRLPSTASPRPSPDALATTHLALKDVPAAITIDSLTETLAILHHDLQSRFGIAQPRILVTGLNPHAGEGGYLGREEIDVINPVLQQAQARGWHVRGPYPADTLFQPKYLHDADCVLAMYHDQGLPVLKYASFGHGVNITLGLPLIRTSVDHGTALDLAAAGLGQADCSSMRFGQNFLTDQFVLQDIIRVIDPQPTDSMVEIGPGEGAMTQHLLQAV